MSDDDALLRLYNQELIAISSRVAAPRVLAQADAAARAVSPICGSEVAVELALDGDRVRDFGYNVEACALTRAVVAIMAGAIRGKTRAEVARAGDALRAMLKEGAPPPAGDWQDLRILAPVADYTARHNAILLPFEAVEKAFALLPGKG